MASSKVDELRATTGYNPRQRVATAYRLLTVVVIAFLYGQPLRFSSLRAFFVRRFGKIRPRAFQLRFKDSKAVAFFRAVLEHMVATVIASTGVALTGPLAVFTDSRVYDGTGQRVPPRGRAALPGCTADKAGAKCLIDCEGSCGVSDAWHWRSRSHTPMIVAAVPVRPGDGEIRTVRIRRSKVEIGTAIARRRAPGLEDLWFTGSGRWLTQRRR